MKVSRKQIKECDDVVEALDEEFRHCLALHLYSWHLVRANNPGFLSKTWTSWPLPLATVPDPAPETKYIELLDGPPAGQLSDPTATLRYELNSAFQRSVHGQLLRRGKQPMVEVEMPEEMGAALASRLEVVMARIQHGLQEDRGRAATKRRLSWVDVMMLAGNERVMEKCRSIFERDAEDYILEEYQEGGLEESELEGELEESELEREKREKRAMEKHMERFKKEFVERDEREEGGVLGDALGDEDLEDVYCVE